MEDCNFIAVDWSAMATGNYSYVGENYVPLAGQLTGQFINFLVEQGTQLENLHLTGHRLERLKFIVIHLLITFNT